MSNAAGEPPQTTLAPVFASCPMTMPLRHSAVCWTTAAASVTGAVAPASGIDTSSAGMPARAQSIRFWHVRSLQSSGGDGQTSNTAIGFAARAASPPAAAESICFITHHVSVRKAPVTIGLRMKLSAR